METVRKVVVFDFEASNLGDDIKQIGRTRRSWKCERKDTEFTLNVMSFSWCQSLSLWKRKECRWKPVPGALR